MRPRWSATLASITDWSDAGNAMKSIEKNGAVIMRDLVRDFSDRLNSPESMLVVETVDIQRAIDGNVSNNQVFRHLGSFLVKRNDIKLKYIALFDQTR